jgi:hypothetical protein
MVRAAIILAASSVVLLIVSLVAALLLSGQGVNAAKFTNRDAGTITCFYWHPYGGFSRRRNATAIEPCKVFEDRFQSEQ